MFEPLPVAGGNYRFPELKHGHYSRAARQGRLKETAATRSARFAGICKCTKTGRWEARLQDRRLPRGRVFLGLYADDQIAALAYDTALVLLGDDPVNLPKNFFDQPRRPDLQTFMQRIAERMGRTLNETSNADAEAKACELVQDNPLTTNTPQKVNINMIEKDPHDTFVAFDASNREVVSVRISNRPDKRAVLYRKDYDRFTAAYGKHSWLLTGAKGHEYVKTRVTGQPSLIVVAHVIIGAKHVRYIDGNRCNLKRSNLYKPTRETVEARRRRAEAARAYYEQRRQTSQALKGTSTYVV